MRPKTVLSLLLVAAGTALGVAGPAVFATAGTALWEAAPVLLLVLGGLALLHVIAPRSVDLILPSVLLLAGAALLAVRSGAIPVNIGLRYGGATLAVTVGVVLAREPRSVIDLQRRRWSVLIPRTACVVEVPTRVRIVACGARFTLNLSNAKSHGTIVECFLSSWYGVIELLLPPGWLAVSGRVDAARFTKLTGRLDDIERYADPSDQQAKEALTSLRAERDAPVVVVLHVLGAGGRVRLQRSSA